MSETIDKRLVEMYFDNAQFEKGAGQSIKTLQNLKKELDLKSTSSMLTSFDKNGALTISDRLGSALTVIEKRFSNLGVAGTAAIHYFVTKGIQSIQKLGQEVGKALKNPIRDGFTEYELKINSIQTMLSNTKSKGTTLDEITKSLEELNVYADKTIYNFADMTQNIGRFTAAGVGLKDSVTSIKGLLNVAAASGSTPIQASSAMYQLSQALAAGTIRLMDWNSVVNAGMGGELFQTAIMETARVMGINIDKLIDKYGSFRETLQTGWLTSEVMVNTLKKFTGDLTRDEILAMGYSEDQVDSILELGQTASDAATKIKTLTQLVSTLKESLGSGWAQTWEAIIGNFEEAQSLWTKVGDALTEIVTRRANQRNDVLDAWRDLGGRDALIEGLTGAFQGLYGVVVAVGTAIRSVFPPVTAEKLTLLSNKVRDIGVGIKRALDFYELIDGYKTIETVVTISTANAEPLLNAIKRGMSGSGVKVLQERLAQMGYDIGESGADGIFGKNTEAALKKFQKDLGLVVDGIYGDASHNSLLNVLGIGEKEVNTIRYAEETVIKFSDALQNLHDITAGISATFRIALQLIGFAWERLVDIARIFKPVFWLIYDGLAAIGRTMVSLSKYFEETTALQDWGDTFKAVLKPVGAVIEWFTNILRYLLGLGNESLRSAKSYEIFFKVFDSAKALLVPLTSTIKALGASIWEFFTVPNHTVKGSEEKITGFAKTLSELKTFLKPVTDWLSGIGDSIVTFLTVEDQIDPETGEKITGYALTLSKIKTFLSPAISWMNQAAQNVINFFTLADRDLNGEKVTMFTVVLSNIKKLLAPVVQWMKDAGQTIYDFFTVADQPVGDTGRMVTKFTKIFEKFKDTMKPVISAVKPVLEFLAELFSALFGVVKGALTGEGLEEALVRFQEVAGPVFEWMKGAKDTVVSFFTSLWESLNTSDMSESEGVLGALVNLLKVIRDWFLSLWDGFLSFISPGEGGSFGDAVTEQLGKVRDICKNIVNVVGKFLSKAVDDVLALSKKVDDSGLVGMITAILGVKAAGTAAGGIKTIADTFASIGGFADLSKEGTLKKFDGLREALKEIFSKRFSGLSDIFHLTRAQPVTKSLLQLSKAIGILSLTLYGLSKMSLEDVKYGGKILGALVAGLLVFFGAVMAIVKNSSSASSLTYFTRMSLGLSVAIGAMALVIKILAKLPTDSAWRGISRLFAVMLLMALFLNSVESTFSSGAKLKGLLSMSAAIGILSLIVVGLSKMEPGALAQGVASVFVMLGAVAIAVRSISEVCNQGFKISGLIGLSLSVAVLSGVMALLGKMRVGQLVQGTVALVVMVEILKRLVKSLSSGLYKGRVQYAGLIALSVAIGILAGIMALIGKMDTVQAIKGAAGLWAVTKILGKIAGSIAIGGKEASKYLGIVPIALAIGIMSLALERIGRMDIWDITKGLIGLTGIVSLLNLVLKALQGGDIPKISSFTPYISIVLILYGMAFMLEKIGSMPIDTIAKGLLGMVGVMASLKLVISAASKMGSTSGVPSVLSSVGVIGALLTFGEVAQKVKDVPTEKIVALAGGISAIFVSLGLFSKLSSGLGVNVGKTFLTIVAIAAAIGAVVAAFSALTYIPGFDEFMSRGATAIGTFIGEVLGTIEAVKLISMSKGLEKLGDTNPDQEGIKNALECAQLISEFSGNLPDSSAWDRLSDVLLGSEMTHFTEDMTSFGSGVAALTNALDGTTIDSSAISNAVGAATMVHELSKTIDPISIDEAIAEKISGGSPFSKFCESLPIFATKLLTASAFLSLVPSDISDKSEEACTAAQAILDLHNDLKPITGADVVYLLFTKETPFVKFCDSMEDFASSIKTASDDLSVVPDGIDTKTTTATTAAGKIHELSKQVGDYTISDAAVNAISKESKFHDFCSELGHFARSIRLASVRLRSVPEGFPDKAQEATDAATSIHTLYSAVNQNLSFTENVLSSILDVDSPFSQFCSSIGDFVTAITGAAENLSGIGSTDITTDVTTATTAAGEIARLISYMDGLSVDTGNWWDEVWGNETRVEQIFGLIDTMSGTVSKLSSDLEGISETSIISDVGTARSVMESLASFLSWIYGDTLGLSMAYDRQSTFADVQRDMLLIKNTLVELTSVSDTAGSTIDYESLGKIQQFIDHLSSFLQAVNALGGESSAEAVTQVCDDVSSLVGMYAGGKTLLPLFSQGDVAKEVDKEAGTLPGSISGFFGTQYDALSTSVDEFNAQCAGAFGGGAIDTSTWFTGIDTTGVNERISGAVKSIGDTMGAEYLKLQDYTNAFNAAGSGLSVSVQTGFNSVGGSEAGELCSAMLREVSSYESSFARAGYNLGLGIRNGIRNSRALVVAAAEATARAALNRIESVFEVQSPSKATERIGVLVDVGLANGILKQSKSVLNAMDVMSGDALDSAQRKFGGVSSLLTDQLDGDPVIRPVVDLTNINQGAREIRSAFYGRNPVPVRMSYTGGMVQGIDTYSNRKEGAGGGSTYYDSHNQGNVIVNVGELRTKNEEDVRNLAMEISRYNRRVSFGLGS